MIFVCEPDKFVKGEPININEKKSFKGTIDVERLKQQHKNMCTYLSKYDEVKFLEPEDNLPEQTFVRDTAFFLDNKIYRCKMKEHVRSGEPEKLNDIIDFDHEFSSTIEGGDVVETDEEVFVGVGNRTSSKSLETLSDLTNLKIKPIRLAKNILHLDCVLNELDGTVFAYKPGIDADDYKYLQKNYEVVSLTKDEFENFNTNFIIIKNNLFISSPSPRIKRVFEKMGYVVHEINLDEFYKLGGSIRCLTIVSPKDNFFHKRYLSYKNNVLYYKNINLLDLVKKYGNPLKVGFPNMIRERILSLKHEFQTMIKKSGYNGKYYYANANKASYYAENVVTAGVYSDFYEVSSYTDLMLVKRIFDTKTVKRKKVICNGIKDPEYLKLICKMVDKGYQILDIVDSVFEYEHLLNYKFKNPIEIGTRVKLVSLYNHNDKIAKYDRFGLYENEIEYVADTYKQNPMLNFTTIHYHQRGSLFDKDKFDINFEKTFEIYAKFSSRIKTIKYFDIGGGCPYDKINEYDYHGFVQNTIDLLKNLSTKYSAKEPDIIQENGRYTVSDACFNIYKVEAVKSDDNPWYLINDSLMTSLPNTWALGEEFLILPINLVENEQVEVRLAGNTCDGDDVYYYQSRDKFKLPIIKEGQTLYIGVFGMGAYQEILSGIGGIHHCLNREENDLIIYKKKGKYHFYAVRNAQSFNHIIKRLLYAKKTDLKRFTN